MHRFWKAFLTAGTIILGSYTISSIAQAAGVLKPSISPPAQLIDDQQAEIILSSSKPATLMRVDDGVFSLQYQGTIDLTEKRVLLAFPPQKNDIRNWQSGSFYITINGESNRVRIGNRIDLKRNRSTREFVKDRDVCILDVTNFIAPKGSPAVATFRLYCL